MKQKKIVAVILCTALITGLFAGCGNGGSQNAGSNGEKTAEVKSTEDTANSKNGKVTLKLFTGKIETIDLMNEIINEFNNSQDRITVMQEYQKDASNIIKIKFAADQAPDIMTTYEQGFVDEGKYLDLSEQSEWWDRLSPAMKEACTDVKSGKQYRV